MRRRLHGLAVIFKIKTVLFFFSFFIISVCDYNIHGCSSKVMLFCPFSLLLLYGYLTITYIYRIIYNKPKKMFEKIIKIYN